MTHFKGEGRFGVVWKFHHEPSKITFAVKVYRYFFKSIKIY